MKRNDFSGRPLVAGLLMCAVSVACGGQPPSTDGPAGKDSAAAAPVTSVRDRSAVEERLRAELARLLKKDAGQLPVDRPVIELGADDLTVVEWQMAAERAFDVEIDDDRLFEPGTKTRRDLTVAAMAAVVLNSPSSR